MALPLLLDIIRSSKEPSRTTEDASIGNAAKQLHLELGLLLGCERREGAATGGIEAWVVREVDAKLELE